MGEPVKKAPRKKGAGAALDPAHPSTVPIAFRVPTPLADRLDRLAVELSAPWHELKRSELARAALERGLEVLEKEAAERRRDG